jgi:signal transduction histidine kinase/DNA-binding response OmpR family regulator
MEQQQGKVKILAVDDRPDKLLVFQAILEELGQTIFTANSGEEALKLVLEHEFAVILLDVNMPGLDGLETAALIRNRKKSAHTPIIFVTAYADEIHVAKCYSLGAVDYILSPVVPEILRTKVRVFVELFRMTERATEQAEERVLLAHAQAARAAAEEASRRSNFLAEAGAQLTQSLELEGRISTLTRLVLSELADVSAVVLLDESGSCNEVDLGRLDANQEPCLEKHSISELSECAFKTAVSRTIETSQRCLLFGADSSSVADEIPADGDDSKIRALKAIATFPLFARKRMLGVLALGLSSPHRTFDDAELALANDLADRAASAFDNAMLYGKLQETDKRKDEFLAMLAHELRNPLAPIRNASTVLQLANADPAKHKWATSVIQRQVAHMVRLLDDLLDVSRITRGKIDLHLAPVEVADIVAGAVETSRPLIDARRHRLDIALPNEPLRIHADATRIEQVLSNLLNNAAKFTDEGGRISLIVERDNAEVVCRVRDSGIGIAGDMLSSIFNLFTQVARAQSIQGSLGIGLTLVRRLVEAHGGTVHALSKGLGQGSEFVVRLPLHLEAKKSATGAHSRTADRRCIGLRVMVVDDDLDGLESTTELLRLHGCDARAFSDGPSALEAFEKFKPEAVLLDLSMPVMDGYEVARRMRASSDGSKLVLVAASGHGKGEDLERSHRAGFDNHLVKPVDPRALISTLTSLCASRQTTPAQGEFRSAVRVAGGTTRT